ncbi:MAG TPA: c-type cytochrome biogenesis protein CcsB [Actinomycetes bacterium]|jgi:cytochrome c-type biogenesis protein CcsB|nr:c-type cytochrome biogenesis protein CcsB [Actinomycetes bacterium]
MPSASLANLSETLVWLAVLSYVVAALLTGFELAYRVAWTGRAGLAVTVVGLGANVAAAVTRSLATHRVPWGNMYEFSIMVGIVTVTAYLVWTVRRPEVRSLGVFILLPAVLVIALAGVALRVPAGPLVPALNSGWIKIHVAAAISGSSILCLGSIFSALYLVRDHFERRSAELAPPLVAGGASTVDRVELRETLAAYVEEEETAAEPQTGDGGGEPRRRALWERLPSSRTLDLLAYRTTTFGFPIWTFAIIAGAIWAQSAWGRYWGWDPKETWSFIVWTIFAAYLHARATAGWRGRRAAWLSLIGFGAMLFNFYAVNTWIVGLHSYAQ